MSTTTMVSVASDGTQGNYYSYQPSITNDGRYIAFVSYANNLVPEDTNETDDIFLRDRLEGSTIRVNVTNEGEQANALSYQPAITGDGRYITFTSFADNLVPGDTNNSFDVFVRDLQTGTISIVSIASDGTLGNAGSGAPAISSDGRYVAFSSSADNLVPGDTNNSSDIFVHDLQTGTTELISSFPDFEGFPSSSSSPTISGDGRYVAFTYYSDYTEAEQIYLYDRQTGENKLISAPVGNISAQYDSSRDPVITEDGRYIAFQSWSDVLIEGGNIYASNIFVYDQDTGTNSLVSVSSDGTQGDWTYSYNPSISNDGRYVAFISDGDYLVPEKDNLYQGIFVHDRESATTSLVSLANDGDTGLIIQDYSSAISGDGRYLAFESDLSTLVPGDTNNMADIFLENLVAEDEISQINGTPRRDELIGTDLPQIIKGFQSNDRLEGNGGDDLLIGGPGNDHLFGGSGRDKFRLNSPSHGVDWIRDFNPTEDTIEILAQSFHLNHGTLRASRFVIGTTAKHPSDRLIYNLRNGSLFFDPDGTGSLEAVKIARLDGFLNLTHNDFVVI